MVIQDDADWTKFAENVVKQRVAETDRQTLRLRWAGVFLLLVLIAGLGWFVYHFVHKKLADHGDRSQSPNTGATYVGQVMLPSLGARDAESTLRVTLPAAS